MQERIISSKGRLVVVLSALASVFPSLAVLYYMQAKVTPQDTATDSVAPPPPEVPVARNVTSLGRIEPKGEVIEVSGPSGSRISQLLVTEGQQVEEGEVLAYLEDYNEKLAERNLAESRLAEANLRYDSATKFAEAQIKEAETRIAQIETPQSLEVKAQKARVRQLEAELNTARKDFERNQFLVKEGAVSRQQLDLNASAFYSKEAELENAKAMLAQLKDARERNLQNAKAQLDSSRAELVRTQSDVDIRSAQNELALAEAVLERSIIRAPRSGRVLDIATYAGETIDEDGILQLGNVSQMYVVAEVYESDITEVELGQRAIITDSSLSEPLHGTVEQISAQIGKNDILDSDPAADIDSRVVEVRIRLDERDSEMVTGLINLQVDVEIESAEVSLNY